jgi:hypothetical protein
LFAFSAHAADSLKVNPKWKLTMENAFGLAQASYSDNWSGGEAGSIIWVSSHRSTAESWVSKSLLWNNQLRLEFGQTHSQSKDKKWQPPAKSSDKIRFDSILKLKKGWAVDPYVAYTLESQFLDASGRDKRYVNPIDMTETIGVARDIFNVPDVRVLSTRVGFGIRQRIAKTDVLNPDSSWGTESKTTNDGGFEWVTDFVLGSAKTKYGYVSKLTLFKAIFFSAADKVPADGGLKGTDAEDYWMEPDLNWDNFFRANLSSILQTSFGWQLLYDKELSLGGRLKQTWTIGLAYKWANFTEAKK